MNTIHLWADCDGVHLFLDNVLYKFITFIAMS